MHLARTQAWRAHFNALAQAAAMMAAAFVIPAAMAPTASAASVGYTISPTSGEVQPDADFEIVLTIRTDVAIAGGSINIEFTNGSFAGFQAGGSPEMSFVDYHAQQNDTVFICNNNRCEPGTYKIATIAVKSGASGVVTTKFVPKETADPELKLLPADGATGSYPIKSTAPPANTTIPKDGAAKNTYTVPKDDGKGGTVPQQITGDRLNEQVIQAQLINELPPDEANDKKFWTFTNVAMIVAGISITLGIILLVVLRIIKGGQPRGPGGFGPPRGPSGPTPPANPSNPNNVVVG